MLTYEVEIDHTCYSNICLYFGAVTVNDRYDQVRGEGNSEKGAQGLQERQYDCEATIQLSKIRKWDEDKDLDPTFY